METEDRVAKVKTHLGVLDDLNQQRRRLFTDWAAQRLQPSLFVEEMLGNLASTRQAAESMEKILR